MEDRPVGTSGVQDHLVARELWIDAVKVKGKGEGGVVKRLASRGSKSISVVMDPLKLAAGKQGASS